MSIIFYCSKCGARFEVGEQAAGKPGRCKRCGERIAVPASSMPEPAATVPVGASAGRVARSSGPGWLERMGSQVGLVPLTVERMPALRKPAPKPSPLDDLGDSKPYAVVSSWKIPIVEQARGDGPAGEVRIVWRRGMGSVQRFFRRLNELAYLISVPFIMVLLIGATARNRSLALLGAEAVVLLNIGRIVSGLANILAVPFRDGPATGVLFLFPPYTIKYTIDHWNKLKAPTRRVVGPLLTIGLVVLAFTFIPSLSGRTAAKAADAGEAPATGR